MEDTILYIDTKSVDILTKDTPRVGGGDEGDE